MHCVDCKKEIEGEVEYPRELNDDLELVVYENEPLCKSCAAWRVVRESE